MQSSTDRIHKLDPLTDIRWPEFLARDPRSSAFHSPEWLRALKDTYGYTPIVFTTTGTGELQNGVVFCEVRSWLTGNRLISLPFSDHCQPLADREELSAILHSLSDYRNGTKCKYIELRPALGADLDGQSGLNVTESFTLHVIDLRPQLEQIYRRFHDSCVRRKIKRAERENLTLESGNTTDLLGKFRHLQLLTRRRHKLPPQPAKWFENLACCLGEKLKIYVLSKDGIPAASILTISYKTSLIYKYGCSDAQFHNLGGMPLLFWKAIQEGKSAGAEFFDLGRSSAEDPGLLAFKGHLGGIASDVNYFRDTPSSRRNEAAEQPRIHWTRDALARLPEPLLVGAGNLLYRHFA
jgi:CelD/BcsL family acetyltransferase involved in cellulose biosynthesis